MRCDIALFSPDLVERFRRKKSNNTCRKMKASSFYRAGFWQIGLFAARKIPAKTCGRLTRILSAIYWIFARRRREIVIQNLLPPLQGNRAEAVRISKKLFHNFAQKLVDLWRYESGVPIENEMHESTGWQHFEKAIQPGRGLLVLTPHLGNWEFGAPLLARHGVKLLVITLEEPDPRLTEIRKASRERWGIETIVIGSDTFAFVEIIRRLEAGAVIALLVDRPPPNSAVPVKLFCRNFNASVAAAELARATGCGLLPVYLPRSEKGYSAKALPEIHYDRATLRSPEARQQLTQKIVDAFAPAIREHLDQWYHFIPIWPEEPK
jgi:KDO2-lipid IV(A) lauroyltransferase